jgi:hypothetical protein
MSGLLGHFGLLSKLANSGNDPYFANVSLLLHGIGSNGSTTITDSSSANRSATITGDTQISTAQSAYGGSSIVFDGTGDRLTYSASAAFNLGSTFTIEFWAYFNTLPGSGNNLRLILMGANGSTSALTIQILGGTGTLSVAVPGGSPTTASSAAGAVVTGIMDHWGIKVNAGSCQIFKNGVQTGSTTAITTQSASASEQLFIGYDTVGTVNYNFNGYLQDLRITKGVARTIVVPTAYYPNS